MIIDHASNTQATKRNLYWHGISIRKNISPLTTKTILARMDKVDTETRFYAIN